AYTQVSSITIQNIVGDPIQLVRHGSSGLAILTINENTGSPGMLYLIQDATFVSKSQAIATPAFRIATSEKLVDFRWKRHSKADIVRSLREKSKQSSSRFNH